MPGKVNQRSTRSAKLAPPSAPAPKRTPRIRGVRAFALRHTAACTSVTSRQRTWRAGFSASSASPPRIASISKPQSLTEIRRKCAASSPANPSPTTSAATSKISSADGKPRCAHRNKRNSEPHPRISLRFRATSRPRSATVTLRRSEQRRSGSRPTTVILRRSEESLRDRSVSRTGLPRHRVARIHTRPTVNSTVPAPLDSM